MPIEIHTLPALLSMETRNAELKISNSMPRLQLNQEQVQINIHNEYPQIQIDQHECFVTSGQKGTKEMSADAASAGVSQMYSYIEKVAADGDSFAAIENNGNVVVAIADRDSYQVYEFNVEAMPKARPRIYTKEGKVTINPSASSYDIKSGVRGELIRGGADIQFIPAKIEYSLRQKPSVDISYVDE